MTEDQKIWLVIGLLALVTYLIRLSFLGFFATRSLPHWAEEALGFVPVTVLPALVMPIIIWGHQSSAFEGPQYWAAGAAALALGMWRRAVAPAFLGGFAVFHAVGLAL